MSGRDARSRGSNAITVKGGAHHPHGLPPQGHEPPFSRGGGFLPMPHPALLEEMREADFARGGGPRGPLIPHHAMIEEKLAAQHQDIQVLLADNQRLAATHVALKQELEASNNELQHTFHRAKTMEMEKEGHLREAHDKCMRMEADFRAADGMKAELVQVRADIQRLTGSKLDLSNQVQALTQDLSKANAEMQQVPALKAEIESMKQVLQRARAAIEYEKKGYAENYEQGQAIESNLITMARELEKLRCEVANAEKRAQAAAAVGNTGPSYGGNTGAGYGGNTGPGYGANASAGYGGNTSAGYGANTSGGYGANTSGGYGANTSGGYGANTTAGYGANTTAGYAGNYSNPDTGYGGNPYPAGYGMNPAQGGTDGSAQYGPGPGAWGAYDAQRGRR